MANISVDVKARLGLSTAVYAAEQVLDHAGIQALDTPLELVPAEAGVAFYLQEVSRSHPEWDDAYVASHPTGAPSSLAFSGEQGITMGLDFLDADETVLVQPRETDEVDLTADIGQPLTVVIALAADAVSAATVSGTAPVGDAGASPLPSGGTGSGAQFNISWTGGVYTLDSIQNGGSGYTVSDMLVATGDGFAGGATPANDVTIEVTAVEDGAITGGHIDNELRIGVLYTKKAL